MISWVSWCLWAWMWERIKKFRQKKDPLKIKHFFAFRKCFPFSFLFLWHENYNSKLRFWLFIVSNWYIVLYMYINEPVWKIAIWFSVSFLAFSLSLAFSPRVSVLISLLLFISPFIILTLTFTFFILMLIIWQLWTADFKEYNNSVSSFFCSQTIFYWYYDFAFPFICFVFVCFSFAHLLLLHHLNR